MQTIIKLLFIGSLLGLSGCSTIFNSGFECSKVGGQKGCVSLSQINDQSAEIAQSEKPKPMINSNTGGPGFTGTKVSVPKVGTPVRIGDSIQKIMLFDYIDTDGNYHDPSIVYTVLSQSKWQNHPVKAIVNMESI